MPVLLAAIAVAAVAAALVTLVLSELEDFANDIAEDQAHEGGETVATCR